MKDWKSMGRIYLSTHLAESAEGALESRGSPPISLAGGAGPWVRSAPGGMQTVVLDSKDRKSSIIDSALKTTVS